MIKRVISVLLLVLILCSCSSNTIKVGDYKIHKGTYYLVGANDELLIGDETGLIVSEKEFYFIRDDNSKYEYTIENNTIKYKSAVFFYVLKDDELSLNEQGTLVYRYEKCKTEEKENNKKDTNDKKNKNESKVKIKEVKKLELVDYKTAEFSMKIPKGWKVSKGGAGMLFGLRVYDPNDDRNQIFYILKEQPFYKDNNACSYYMTSMGYCPGIPMGGSPSTEQVFKVFNNYADKTREFKEFNGLEFPYISNFNVIEKTEGNSILHDKAVDDKVLRATFNNGSAKNDGESEGLFNACVVDFGSLGYGMDKFSYYMAYNVSGITTAKDELINNEEELLKSLNSIQFSSSYAQSTVDQINAQTKNALNLSNQLRQAYQSYNDAWSKRQKTYDIMSQKRSDATLGYERVYDTETGEIYKAYNGFTSDYKGNRYEAISDNQYSEKISGYIEK